MYKSIKCLFYGVKLHMHVHICVHTFHGLIYGVDTGFAPITKQHYTLTELSMYISIGMIYLVYLSSAYCFLELF